MSFASALDDIHSLMARIRRPVRLMEVCGTHTMTAFRSGLRALLPADLTLVSGPGCPVCVTTDAYVDAAIAAAQRPNTLTATFGDLLRVPGTDGSLEDARAGGAQVRIVYSPTDALDAARKRPDMQVVFLGVGFETTAPAVAWTVRAAAEEGVANFAVLCAHKTMPRAMAALLEGGARLDGFLCPGHVSAVIGARAYDVLARNYRIPCVVAGFEPADMAEAIALLLRQTLEKRAEVEIQYHRGASPDGNARALAMLDEVFEACDAEWRGLGVIPLSGLKVRARYAAQDAGRRETAARSSAPRFATDCRCGDVLRGALTPPQCPLFGARCTPATPVGACMVSGEGTCAAYFRYAPTPLAVEV